MVKYFINVRLVRLNDDAITDGAFGKQLKVRNYH